MHPNGFPDWFFAILAANSVVASHHVEHSRGLLVSLGWCGTFMAVVAGSVVKVESVGPAVAEFGRWG